MNSFELYTQFLQENKTQPLHSDQKVMLMGEVIKAVYEEVNEPPFELGNSPFFAEIDNIIKLLTAAANKFFVVPWAGRSIVIVDAFAVARGVRNFFNNPDYGVLHDETILTYKKNLFADGDYRQYQSRFIAEIQQDLSEVVEFLRDLRRRYPAQNFSEEVQPQTQTPQLQPQPAPKPQPQPTVQTPPIQPKPTADVPPQTQTSPTVTAQPQTSQPQAPVQPIQPKPKPTILRQAQPTAPPVQIPAQISTSAQSSTPVQTSAQQSSSVMQNYAEKTNAQIELQKHIVKTEAERTKRSEARREENRQKISAWHDEQSSLMRSVRELQQPAQTLLESFRNFSNNITENYVIQFAKNQIDLFNLIADNFASHVSKAEASQNTDYYNAVSNCESYLEMIVDALADFGIEEISSSSGTRFDGKIHDVKNTKTFSPQTATVKKSLRAGFRYGDLILQKESVEV